jgi:hypothetical protein
MKIKFTALLLIALILSGCKTMTEMEGSILTTSVAKTQYGVVLKANSSGLKIESKAKGWKKDGKKNGYVGFDEGESGLITFAIKNEDIDDRCKPPAGGGLADWVITLVELSATGDVSTEKGTNFGGDQKEYPWLKEAFPDVTLEDGVIFKAKTLAEGRTSLTLFSANQQIGETFTFYRITATRCSTGETVRTDPGVGNGGKK